MAKLLRNTSPAAIQENVRVLKNQGYSETDAVKRAHGAPESDEPDAVEESEASEAPNVDPDEEEVSTASDRQFVIVTADYSGLGWAKKLHEEGETVTLAVRNPEDKPEHRKQFDQVAKGWLTTMELSEAVNTLRTDNTYWLFSENCFTEEAEQLRKAGQKVFGTSTLSERMEHDRQYAIDIAKDYGLESPPTHEFSTRQEGLAFLDQNEHKAYVFKPNDAKANHLTFVPVRQKDEDANREVYTYLDHMKQEPGTYILQERVHGVELNVEAWLYEGEPFFAFATLEAKRKDVHDLGEMAGCAGDFAWVTPLDSALVEHTIGRMLPFYKEQKYTGFADVNVILSDQGPLFLEVCDRFGYNGHVTLFLGLALDGFGSVMADFMDGHIEHMTDRFSHKIGSSLTLFLDHPREGLPIHIDEQAREQLYLFDGYQEDDTMLLAGYSNEVGVLTASDYTIEGAAQKVLDKLLQQEAVSFPDFYVRTDLGKTDYPNACVSRYHALQDRYGHSMMMSAGSM